MDDGPTVTTSCSRCRRAIVWAQHPMPAGRGVEAYRLEVVGAACHCDLTDDEWHDLSEQAIEALEEGAG